MLRGRVVLHCVAVAVLLIIPTLLILPCYTLFFFSISLFWFCVFFIVLVVLVVCLLCVRLFYLCVIRVDMYRVGSFVFVFFSFFSCFQGRLTYCVVWLTIVCVAVCYMCLAWFVSHLSGN